MIRVSCRRPLETRKQVGVGSVLAFLVPPIVGEFVTLWWQQIFLNTTSAK